MLKIFRVTKHFSWFFYKKKDLFLNCYSFKKQYFLKQLRISLNIFKYKIKKLVFSQIEKRSSQFLNHIMQFFYKSGIKTLNAFFSKQHFCKWCRWFEKFYQTDCSHFLIFYSTQQNLRSELELLNYNNNFFFLTIFNEKKRFF